MIMKYIVFLICTIIVIGCSGSDSSTITNTMETMKAPRYTVYADDIFTDNHKVDIVAALE
jgi:hypothetical protein